MTTDAPAKPKTTIWTCGCGAEIPVGPDTLEFLKTGDVVVCTCDSSESGSAS